MTNLEELMDGLPGEAMIRSGLADYQAGRRTVNALAAASAQTRLREAGLLPGGLPAWPEPELTLYRLLRQEPGDAYSRYNAILRELSSFLNALDRRLRLRGEAGGQGRRA
ncbi:MAG TPA: hypothetical protein VN515_03460 [Terriglobales bacterium]|nr:hypothetical protein [Terriglobales bacterium]